MDCPSILCSPIKSKCLLTRVCFALNRFVRNCVPQISGINIDEGVSIAFFCLTIFNLILLIFFHQIVAYGMTNMIKWQRIISIIYGLTLIVLAILAIVLEDSDMDTISSDVWAALSSNQKTFFDDDVEKLQAERSENNLFVGIFAIVIGVFFIVIGGLMFKLH